MLQDVRSHNEHSDKLLNLLDLTLHVVWKRLACFRTYINVLPSSKDLKCERRGVAERI